MKQNIQTMFTQRNDITIIIHSMFKSYFKLILFYNIDCFLVHLEEKMCYWPHFVVRLQVCTAKTLARVGWIIFLVSFI